jgi:hypothetical protein
MSFLQTLASAFKGGGGARVPLARSFTSPWTFAFEPSGARLPFDYSRAIKHAYLENPVAQRAVRLVCEGVAGAPLTGDARLLALVGATSAGQALLETLAAQLLLHGNGFVQVLKDASGAPVELYALRPERVSVVPDEAGWPAAYQYKVGDKTLAIPIEDEGGWPNLIHLKSFHPADDHSCSPPSLEEEPMSDPVTFTSVTPRHQIPLIFSGQSQKELTVNEAHTRADALLHPAIEGAASDPPADPEEGECWLVGADPTGAWTDEEGKLACRQLGNWLFAAPRDGMQVLDKSTGQQVRYLGGWQVAEAPAEPSGGATADAEARAAIVGLIDALRTAGIFAAA